MKFSADFIASQVGGVVEGNGAVEVDSFCKIDEGRPGALSFLSNPKYTHYLYETEASVVLVKKNFKAEHSVKATLIRARSLCHPVGFAYHSRPCSESAAL